MVTGFYDTGMSFSFAAQVTWVMHGLGVGMYVGVLFAFHLRDILDFYPCLCLFFLLSRL